MHEIILEIIQRNYNEFTGTNEAETCSASEIASLVRGFEEWKDNMLFEDILSYWQSSNLYNLWKEDRDNTGDINYVFIGEYTLDELFSYWYQNVKSKNN